ncbi:MAG TPA: ABC transporter permease, partial [Cryomorphaceae bacterium]|nr:ABC transporter permease [Cryomorphaceae bacterium]
IGWTLMGVWIMNIKVRYTKLTWKLNEQLD